MSVAMHASHPSVFPPTGSLTYGRFVRLSGILPQIFRFAMKNSVRYKRTIRSLRRTGVHSRIPSGKDTSLSAQHMCRENRRVHRFRSKRSKHRSTVTHTNRQNGKRNPSFGRRRRSRSLFFVRQSSSGTPIRNTRSDVRSAIIGIRICSMYSRSISLRFVRLHDFTPSCSFSVSATDLPEGGSHVLGLSYLSLLRVASIWCPSVTLLR